MRCPICNKSVEEPQQPTGSVASRAPTPSPFPFCSDRCKLIDLGRWLDGRYQVPVVEEDGDEGSLHLSADD
jgi:endogenous inhibitor of DNA gyrase (YacG/DUF329 family)